MDIKIISGGALGADSVWSYIAEQNGVPKENIKHLISFGLSRPVGSSDRREEQSSGTEHIVSEADIEEAVTNMINLNLVVSGKPAKTFFIKGSNGYTTSQKLHARNYWQVALGDQVLAVVTLAANKVSGGTATAVNLAIKLNKPVYILNTRDARWYKYNYNIKKFVICEDPKPVDKNTCIGTRTLVQYKICKWGQWVNAPYVGSSMETKLREQMTKFFN